MLALLGVALVVVAVLLADRFGRRIVRPVRDLAEASRRLGAGDLDARVAPAGPPEIAEVGQVTNRLAERIVELLTAERELVADVSHRLRTPLAVLRLDAEQLPPGPATERVREDLDVLEHDLTMVIQQARRGFRGPASTIDLVGLVRDRAAFWSALAEEQQRPWSVTVPDRPLTVASDREELAAALDAVLGNVFTHTDEPAGCRISLLAINDEAVLTVADDGPGFVQGAPARGSSGAGSTGLGLDIARRVAESAGGRLAVENAPGGGARVTLTFPLAGPT